MVDAFVLAAEVEAPVGVEVAVGDDGAELQDGFGAFEAPSRAWSESRTSAGRAAAAGGGAVGSGWAGLAAGCFEFSGGGVDGL
ncbi:MAG: hypothetical protein ACRDOU_23815, partial [Streptosporangiaceae bacterium]